MTRSEGWFERALIISHMNRHLSPFMNPHLPFLLHMQLPGSQGFGQSISSCVGVPAFCLSYTCSNNALPFLLMSMDTAQYASCCADVPIAYISAVSGRLSIVGWLNECLHVGRPA